jgi:hypothetical protein
MKEHRYVIRKYVQAPSVKEALEKEPNVAVSEVFIEESKDDNGRSTADGIGFKYVDVEFPYEY